MASRFSQSMKAATARANRIEISRHSGVSDAQKVRIHTLRGKELEAVIGPVFEFRAARERTYGRKAADAPHGEICVGCFVAKPLIGICQNCH